MANNGLKPGDRVFATLTSIRLAPDGHRQRGHIPDFQDPDGFRHDIDGVRARAAAIGLIQSPLLQRYWGCRVGDVSEDSFTVYDDSEGLRVTRGFEIHSAVARRRFRPFVRRGELSSTFTMGARLDHSIEYHDGGGAIQERQQVVGEFVVVFNDPPRNEKLEEALFGCVSQDCIGLIGSFLNVLHSTKRDHMAVAGMIRSNLVNEPTGVMDMTGSGTDEDK
jgi:hypothetical protein